MTNTEPPRDTAAPDILAEPSGPAIIEVRNPGTGEVVGTVADESPDAVAATSSMANRRPSSRRESPGSSDCGGGAVAGRDRPSGSMGRPSPPGYSEPHTRPAAGPSSG